MANLKICSFCNQPKLLWKSNPKACKDCWYKNNPIKIKKISDSHKETLREYKPEREQFLKEHPFCELKLEGCTKYSTEVEHRAGKATKELYLDKSKWFASCRNCNTQIEVLSERYELGLKIKHNSK